MFSCLVVSIGALNVILVGGSRLDDKFGLRYVHVFRENVGVIDNHGLPFMMTYRMISLVP